MEQSCSIYILECADGMLYVGMSSQLERRIESHILGNVTSTKKRLPIRLLWSREIGDRELTHKMELYLKKWKRDRKMKLAQGDPYMLYYFDKYLCTVEKL